MSNMIEREQFRQDRLDRQSEYHQEQLDQQARHYRRSRMLLLVMIATVVNIAVWLL